MRDIGVGVISLGWVGRLHSTSYLAAPLRYPDLGVRTRLVAAADPVPEAREYAVGQLGFARATADYREVLADPEFTVVSICSPNCLHKEIALAAAAAGKPFWIEKPMGVSAAESAAIAQAAQGAGLVTSVGFNYRHAPAIARARQLIREGALGRVTNVRVWLIADYTSSPDGPLTWRYDPARAGSGVVGDLMSHGLDLAQFLVGRVASVTSLTSTFITERPIPTKVGVGHGGFEIGDERGPVQNEDYVGILARFDSGVVGTLESSRVSIGPRSEYVVEVYGTEGSVRWNFERINELQTCLVSQTGGGPEHGYTTALAGPHHGDFARFQPGPGVPMGFDDLKVSEAQLFLRSVVTGTQLAPSVADGWAAAEAAEAAVASAADGRWHDVPHVEGTTTYDA